MARGERRQNLARLGEIAQVAARHGFGYVFGRKDIPPEPLEEGPAGKSRGRRLREMLDELGPTFVKFGQLLSTRPDIVPPDILEELRGLQDDARPEPFEQVRAVVEAELGLTIEQIFEEFDEQPIAAASIGQVHRARLPGGQQVVVKVQRPDAERQISGDIQLLYQAAKVAQDRIRRLQFIDLVETVDEFARTIRRELDYGIEARNAEVFRRNFGGDETVAVPKVYWRYTTPRVLTMERVEGTTLRQLDLAAWSAADRVTLANRITQTWMQMVFVHGFFHADPHPANILVRDPDRISVVDCGMTEQLSQRDREALVRLLIDIIDQDAERLPRRLRALGVRFPRAKEEELADRLAVIVQRYSAIAIGDIDIREVLREIFGTVYAIGVTLPARWVMLDKTVATLAGVALEISPDFDVFAVARPYAVRLVADRYRPDRIAGRVRADLTRYAEAMLDYPFQVSELLDEFKDGDVEIRIKPEGFDQAVEKLEATANRVVLSVIAASLFLTSAVIAVFAHYADVAGLSLLALPGLIAAIVLLVWLCVGIFRSGRW
ncbi:MAG TPA: AarF/ABC1/UbiB kinase family protein [Miltoncostaeaceae bacterium]|nr:AarF/ABC1/UbiB kinase family protein [Miltoncostaeaceae bacterium]